MSRLRSDATQAIAEKTCGAYSEGVPAPCPKCLARADKALDSLLDYLEAHTKEWSAAAIQRLKDRGYSRLDSVPDWESELLQSLRVEP